jgi:dolichol-phosphate mannosyltransferase
MSAVSPLVVIPTYDEAANIDTVLRSTRTALPSAHVLVVDDGSPDGTADLADAVAEELGAISVMRRAAKSGLGSAYRAGFAWGLERGHDVLIEMDADLSHDPAALPSLVARSGPDAGLVIGSRYVPGGGAPHWPRRRLALSRGGNLYSSIALGVPVHDLTAGFRVYRADVLRGIDYATTTADGYGFQVEMAYRVHQIGAGIVEVPITFADRVRGTSKMSGSIVVEAMWLVTKWGIRDRVLRRPPTWRAPTPSGG